MTAINYGTGPRITNIGDHTVYTKATWSAAWTAQANLVCVECEWKAAPDFSSALLIWRTGTIIPPGGTAPTLFGPWVGRGHFVRIDWTCDDGTILKWVGFIDQGAWPTEAFGDQPLVCYGLERALALTPIVDMAWQKGATTLRSAEFPFFGTNRNSTADAGGVFVFHDPRSTTAPEKWSTRKAVQYLLKYNLPTSNFGVANIPWSVDQITQLPDWDTVTTECRGRTVWDVLSELVSADRQLGMTSGSDGTTVFLRFFTHTSAAITVGTNTLAANPNQHTLVFAPDALTTAQLSDVGGGYDQVICRGAKRMTICTLSHLTQIENDWTAAQETEYEAGASADATYAAANSDEKRILNAAARKASKVYTQFKILSSWDWMLGAELIFDGNANPRSVRLLDRLPIKPTVDWSGTVDPTEFEAEPGRPMLVLFANPDSLLKYVDVAKFALTGEAHTNTARPHDLSVSAETVDYFGSPQLRLKVRGGPNHAIAGTNFSKLPVDTMDYGGLDYSTMKITVAIEEDRYCEGRYPSAAPSADVVRRLVVECGDLYRQIKIHKDTIADLQVDGTDKKVTASAYLQDDSEKLAAIAQVIALGAVLTRKRVSWNSLRRISTVAVGDMITTAAGATVLAPIMSVRIKAPMGLNRPALCPQQSFESFTGTQDPLNVLRRLGMVI